MKDRLDKKPNQALVIPNTLDDIQALLDNSGTMNFGFPELGEDGSDNYYLLYTRWASLGVVDRNVYTWQKDVFAGASIFDWIQPYKQIFYSNIALDALSKIDSNTNQTTWNNLRGSALFYRAHALTLLAQIFCKTYDVNTASSDLGLPVRTSPDVNVISTRSSVKQTYDQIISDLNNAIPLLSSMPAYRTRPSKWAAYALLSRIYLIMQNYDKVLQNASASLNINNTLLDYNQIPTGSNSSYPMPKYNGETIFYGTFQTSLLLNPNNAPVDTLLYKAYGVNDLRRTLFFRSQSNGTITFRGSYSKGSFLFAGLAVDEIYLNRAEANARNGNISDAMKDLNDLLRTRWKVLNGVSTYVDQTATTASDALSRVLLERRKELLFRGLRWVDLRRLNKEPQFAMTLTRVLNGQTYSLPPNDNRYVYPIPDDEIKLSAIEQNPR